MQHIATAIVGKWESLENEVRPNPWGGQYFLRRYFHNTATTAHGTLVFYTDDSYAHKNLTVEVIGPYQFLGPSASVAGATETDFEFTTIAATPHTQTMVDMLNAAPAAYLQPWQVGVREQVDAPGQGIMGMVIGEYKEYDVTKVADGLLYYGERPTDGSAPDTAAKRATALQVPLKKVSTFSIEQAATSTAAKTIIILGAGAGISQSVAKTFGKQGFLVALVSRNADKLAPLVAELAKDNIQARAFSADVSDEAALKQVVANITQLFGRIDVVHYNAVAMRMVHVLEETAHTLVQDFKVNVAGLQTIALLTMDALAANKGALLTTGGGFALYPSADFASLSIGKAGIRNLSESLSQALAPKGIFVGTLTIKGFVAPDAEIYNPDNIALHFWKLYTERAAFEIQF